MFLPQRRLINPGPSGFSSTEGFKVSFKPIYQLGNVLGATFMLEIHFGIKSKSSGADSYDLGLPLKRW